MKKYKINKENGDIVSQRAVILRNPLLKMKGLLGRKAIGEEEAYIFYHASSIHTYGMKFDIDVVFLDKNKYVKKIISSMAPGRIVNCNSYATIEFPKNRMKEKNVIEGSKLEWFVSDESGQVILEYALILAVFVIAIIGVAIPLVQTTKLFMQHMINYLVDI
ncbi:MAG: DUF192 domain-containing protein [Caldisericia bacterium]|nr:DUF192 domain-containing protein [Caldisericia bacterium]